MSVGYVTHDETMIETFMEDPEYAEHLLEEVMKDGDEKEIAYFQNLCNEAKKRREKTTSKNPRWAKVAAVL